MRSATRSQSTVRGQGTCLQNHAPSNACAKRSIQGSISDALSFRLFFISVAALTNIGVFSLQAMLEDLRVNLNLLQNSPLSGSSTSKLLIRSLASNADERWSRHVSAGESPMRHDRPTLRKSLSDQELIREHAETLQANCGRIPILLPNRLDHLRRQIVQNSTHDIASIVQRMHALAKTRFSDLTLYAYKSILRLDVSVHNVLAMQTA